ncbi:glycosyltransferase [Chryseobacterium sp. JJR-5R]|uniref:glycosyltransferase family 2 protein n=1 Tax=Chryseobacterium sp. JJR-5R TaxID=3093923 RepID=UPI002A7628E1|nr:glycosyltransferase [Chryseobacterium sp. JJR-5R]WPO83078.1 glycosyltransferase [Chryseobacterium sp. JJR-5R]
MKDILVSVAMPNYGQAEFISEAILGVLSQQANFEIELIVADDCSPDHTEDIVQHIIRTHPNGHWIKYIKHAKNKGAIPNFVWTLSQAKGKYIAACEGDDYWTDPLKLQKQIDFLENNNDYILCFHKVKILTPAGDIIDDFITKIPKNYELRKTLVESSNYIHTPSVVFRNINLNEYHSLEFQKTPIGDYFLYLALTNYGKIGYIDEVMCVYRHGVGIYSSLDKMKMMKADLQLFINLYSFEKDLAAKNIFYKNILGILENIQKINNDLTNENKLLTTRRHKIIEKLYRFIKR